MSSSPSPSRSPWITPSMFLAEWIRWAFHLAPERSPSGPGFSYQKAPLHEHPAGTDDVRPAVAVDVHREFAVVVGFRAVGLRPVAKVGVFFPVRRFVPIASGGDVQVSVAVEVGHGATLGERPEPIGMLLRIMHRPVDLHRQEELLPGLRGATSSTPLPRPTGSVSRASWVTSCMEWRLVLTVSIVPWEGTSRSMASDRSQTQECHATASSRGPACRCRISPPLGQ